MEPTLNKTEKFFLCECSLEGLLISNFNDEDKQIYLAMFSYGTRPYKRSVWERLKYAWWHIRTGEIYKDELVLSYEKANEIGKFLVDNTK